MEIVILEVIVVCTRSQGKWNSLEECLLETQILGPHLHTTKICIFLLSPSDSSTFRFLKLMFICNSKNRKILRNLEPIYISLEHGRRANTENWYILVN